MDTVHTSMSIKAFSSHIGTKHRTKNVHAVLVHPVAHKELQNPERLGTRGVSNNLLLALVMSPLTTHPFRDGAPFLLPIDTSNIWAIFMFSLYWGGVKITKARAAQREAPSHTWATRPSLTSGAIQYLSSCCAGSDAWGTSVDQVRGAGYLARLKGPDKTTEHT